MCWSASFSAGGGGTISGVAMGSVNLQLDHVVLDEDFESVNRFVRRERHRLAGAQVEERAVARALDRAALLVEGPLGERAVVVRAAILDGEEVALAVEDADLEVLPRHDARGAGGKLVERADVDDGAHGNSDCCGLNYSWAGGPNSASASDGGVAGSQSTDPPSPALLRTFSDSSAHFIRVAEMSIPSRSRTNERSSLTTSSTFIPLTSSDAIDAAAWLIAQPWPSKRTSCTMPSASTRSMTLSSSPQSGLLSSNSRS